ncbi:MAG: hypothetical protein BWX70_02849 [Verrucomicrobia bacterium ADurb.Bin070]|nr:MAG: hypothetical protein BWX70_02849 [Verrucomicrobia bacterium ADurb.Bin070]
MGDIQQAFAHFERHIRRNAGDDQLAAADLDGLARRGCRVVEHHGFVAVGVAARDGHRHRQARVDLAAFQGQTAVERGERRAVVNRHAQPADALFDQAPVALRLEVKRPGGIPIKRGGRARGDIQSGRRLRCATEPLLPQVVLDLDPVGLAQPVGENDRLAQAVAADARACSGEQVAAVEEIAGVGGAAADFGADELVAARHGRRGTVDPCAVEESATRAQRGGGVTVRGILPDHTLRAGSGGVVILTEIQRVGRRVRLRDAEEISVGIVSPVHHKGMVDGIQVPARVGRIGPVHPAAAVVAAEPEVGQRAVRTRSGCHQFRHRVGEVCLTDRARVDIRRGGVGLAHVQPSRHLVDAAVVGVDHVFVRSHPERSLVQHCGWRGRQLHLTAGADAGQRDAAREHVPRRAAAAENRRRRHGPGARSGLAYDALDQMRAGDGQRLIIRSGGRNLAQSHRVRQFRPDNR